METSKVMSNVMRYLITGVISVATFALIVSGASDIPQTPRTLVVPDEYKSISAAVAKARSGDTVFVKSGIYKEKLRFKEGISLVGEGMDKTIIRYNARPDHVILVENCKSGLISNLTVEHRGQYGVRPALVALCIANSSIEVSNCRIRYASSSGIFVTNGGCPVIHDCIIESNPGSGIIIEGKRTDPNIMNNLCRLNKTHGIYFYGGAKGKAEGNICEENERGIGVTNKGTSVTLKGNYCRGNYGRGIVITKTADVKVEENFCSENEKSGISVWGRGTIASLKDNVCSGNDTYGIGISSGAKVTAKNNLCENNDWPGIQVNSKGTLVSLENNRCRGNNHSGIQFDKNSGGKAIGNICENNPWSGIAVRGKGTKPVLSGNKCNNNGAWGIIYWAGAEPSIGKDNVTLGNSRGGIKARD